MRSVKFIVLITIIVLALSGCAVHRSESAAEERVSLDYSPPYSVVLAPMTSVRVNDARAYQDGEYFVVSGRVKRMHKVRRPGHLDLAVCGSDGKLLAQETTRISGLHSNRKRVMTLPFRFKLAMAPPEGAIIRTSVPRTRFEGSRYKLCKG